MTLEPELAERLAKAVANLDAWLETMRQPGGYGGPVAHWWQNRFQYVGPGLDWRYEGILIGYAELYRKTCAEVWRRRMVAAADDLVSGQRSDGSYRASRFEINPDALGTPHEAAATHGLLTAIPGLPDPGRTLQAVNANLDGLVAALWDGKGFNDRPGGHERVPNKLATLAAAFLVHGRDHGDERALGYARSALDDVLRYQVGSGGVEGAVHQYVPGLRRGDGRFFPYYNARCIPPLVLGASVLDEPRYHDAALAIRSFVDRSMRTDGSWPQVVYENGRSSEWPRWIAGTADILLAYEVLGARIPSVALERLLDGQTSAGAFRTAAGFQSQIRQSAPTHVEFRDVVPVVGWNDKVLRLLVALLGEDAQIPEAAPSPFEATVVVGTSVATYREDRASMRIETTEGVAYAFDKGIPWASRCNGTVNAR